MNGNRPKFDVEIELLLMVMQHRVKSKSYNTSAKNQPKFNLRGIDVEIIFGYSFSSNKFDYFSTWNETSDFTLIWALMP